MIKGQATLKNENVINYINTRSFKQKENLKDLLGMSDEEKGISSEDLSDGEHENEGV